MKGYRWESNEYRLSAIQFSYPIKYLLATNQIIDVKAISKSIEPTMNWPVQLNVSRRLQNTNLFYL